jgi:hypothetical protein
MYSLKLEILLLASKAIGGVFPTKKALEKYTTKGWPIQGTLNAKAAEFHG